MKITKKVPASAQKFQEAPVIIDHAQIFLDIAEIPWPMCQSLSLKKNVCFEKIPQQEQVLQVPKIQKIICHHDYPK